jgi:membrane protease YdiL (CAAX protease family)
VDSSLAFVRRARRGLAAYLLLVVTLSAIGEGAAILTGQYWLVYVVMLMPAVSSAIVRIARHEGFADVSFRWGGRRTWLVIGASIAMPLVVGGVAYGLAWSLGLAELQIPTSLPGGSDLLRFVYILVVYGGLNWLFGLVLTTGEEVGWRGYMLLRLIDGRVPFPILTSGLIWGLWHTPLIMAGIYAAGPNLLLSVGVFMVGVVAISALLAWARLVTGSIWPPIVMHAAWNAIIQSVFDRVTVGGAAAVWVGESGVLVAAVLVGLALLTTWSPWSTARTPRIIARADAA